MRPLVKAFFDEKTFTVSYVVTDEHTRKCAIIDPVLDYDQASGRTSTQSADTLLEFIKDSELTVEWILETHVHADHFSAAPYLREKTSSRVAIGSGVTIVQEAFGSLFNAEESFRRDGSQFDHLLEDNEAFSIGELNAVAMHTPGHTPACMTYVIGDAAFVGDTMFMPDYGSARADFPGGDAGQLYRSIQKIFALPPETRLFMCHDYKAPGRDEYRWETTVEEQCRDNIHLHRGVTESEFVELRMRRDATLSMPALILPAVQVNMRAGELPPAEGNGTQYLKIPLNAV